MYSGQHVACLLLTATSAMLAHLGHQLMLFANLVLASFCILFSSPSLHFLLLKSVVVLLVVFWVTGQLYLRASLLYFSHEKKHSFLYAPCCSHLLTLFVSLASNSTICSYILSPLFLRFRIFCLFHFLWRQFFFIA